MPELLSLHRLYLQGNNISDAAAAAVAAAIDAVLLPAETPTSFKKKLIQKQPHSS